MSAIYITEPPTNGKVIITTSIGDIDIELWSKEAPKAVRNFVQLCLEHYYDNTIFHRIIKGFMMQGGDPSGTGTGGESIFGSPFADEFHQRLRFSHRGIVAMANAAANDNQSQFFITFDQCEWLQKKHTIFGKVTGDSIFNVMKLDDCECDANERPVYPPKIISVEVLHNPFPDIVPRLREISKPIQDDSKNDIKQKKNIKLLSFGDAEEDDANVDAVKLKKGSSHDLVNDDSRIMPNFSTAEAAQSTRARLTKPGAKPVMNAIAAASLGVVSRQSLPTEHSVSSNGAMLGTKRTASQSRSRSRSRSHSSGSSRSRSRSPPESNDPADFKERAEYEKEKSTAFMKDRHNKLLEMRESQQKHRVSSSHRGVGRDEELMTDLERRRSKFMKLKKSTQEREQHTLEKLERFHSVLRQANNEPEYLKTKAELQQEQEQSTRVTHATADEVPVEETTTNWLTHQVKFVHRPQDFDPMARNQDKYEYASFDPRKAAATKNISTVT